MDALDPTSINATKNLQKNMVKLQADQQAARQARANQLHAPSGIGTKSSRRATTGSEKSVPQHQRTSQARQKTLNEQIKNKQEEVTPLEKKLSKYRGKRRKTLAIAFFVSLFALLLAVLIIFIPIALPMFGYAGRRMIKVGLLTRKIRSTKKELKKPKAELQALVTKQRKQKYTMAKRAMALSRM